MSPVSADGEFVATPEFRPRELLRELSGHGVRFVVIGGFAVGAHGYPRATRDLDIVPEPGAENMRRLAEAIERLEGQLHGVDAESLGIELNGETLGNGANFPLNTIHGRLDILQQLGDCELHLLAFDKPIDVEIDGVPVTVCSLETLRRLKADAGRPQDLADIAALDELEDGD